MQIISNPLTSICHLNGAVTTAEQSMYCNTSYLLCGSPFSPAGLLKQFLRHAFLLLLPTFTSSSPASIRQSNSVPAGTQLQLFTQVSCHNFSCCQSCASKPAAIFIAQSTRHFSFAELSVFLLLPESALVYQYPLHPPQSQWIPSFNVLKGCQGRM